MPLIMINHVDLQCLPGIPPAARLNSQQHVHWPANLELSISAAATLQPALPLTFTLIIGALLSSTPAPRSGRCPAASDFSKAAGWPCQSTTGHVQISITHWLQQPIISKAVQQSFWASLPGLPRHSHWPACVEFWKGF